jgi:hypothetical protein
MITVKNKYIQVKNIFFITMIFSVSLISCRGNEADVQQIDQVINLYYKDASGKDLLNTKLSGTYNNIKLLDLNGLTDQVAINSFSLKKDLDTVNYIDYDSGAARVLLDSISPVNKTYHSDFIINFTKNTDVVGTAPKQDTIRIEYSWTPTLFQISKLYYNKRLKFTKVQGQPNIITITK